MLTYNQSYQHFVDNSVNKLCLKYLYFYISIIIGQNFGMKSRHFILIINKMTE